MRGWRGLNFQCAMVRSKSGFLAMTALSAALLCARDKAPGAQDVQGAQPALVAVAADAGLPGRSLRLVMSLGCGLREA